MKWLKLYTKLGKQNMSVTNNQDVYAMLDMNDGLGVRKVYLDLKFDKSGHPYLAQSANNASVQEKPIENNQEQLNTSAPNKKAPKYREKRNYNVHVTYRFTTKNVSFHDDSNFLRNIVLQVQANSLEEVDNRVQMVFGSSLVGYTVIDFNTQPHQNVKEKNSQPETEESVQADSSPEKAFKSPKKLRFEIRVSIKSGVFSRDIPELKHYNVCLYANSGKEAFAEIKSMYGDKLANYEVLDVQLTN